jgi:hypothetical protein
MRMKMIPPPMEMGRLCGQGKRVFGKSGSE